ncbi:hypothetical protein [Vibrio comitans]|uniref:Solute-binding protein family 3/N-terminal domain-containing protein n=1 Tax=Vibrio comitans NBRC 102076 TaxID=1219078 RepID=A0A4Y3IMR7_9VIBR|nr:hypothetical protein [Vibrio comitans]GEA60791.1 hypothetical protein VCO01S_19840 [Vibrio comitans NBRC 102076]
MKRQHYYRYSIFSLLIFTLVGVLIYFSSQHTVSSVPLEHRFNYKCDVSQPTGTRVFQIYTPVAMDTERFNAYLCDVLLIDSQYSQVVTSHLPRSNISANHLSTEPFSLVFSRDYLMSSALPGFQSFYTELLTLPTYYIYWVSSQPISPSLFQTVSIGLLNDEKSQSGYLEPVSYLLHLGLDPKTLDIQLFSNRGTMQQAFDRGDITIMPFASLNSIENYEHTQLINDRALLGSWYVHRSVPAGVAYRLNAMLKQQLREMRSYDSTKQ